MSQVLDFYALLGLSSDATPEDIKRQYRKLARQWHPDALVDVDADVRKAGDSKFPQISIAYECLSNPKMRQVYDMGGEYAGYCRFASPSFADVDDWRRPHPGPESEADVVVPAPEVYTYNGVQIRVAYHLRDEMWYGGRYVVATVRIDVADLHILHNVDTYLFGQVLDLKARASVDGWYVTHDGRDIFHARYLSGLEAAHQGWLKDQMTQQRKRDFDDRLRIMDQEFRRLRSIGRPIDVLRHLMDEAHKQVQRLNLHRRWERGTTIESIEKALHAVQNEIDRIANGGIDLLIGDLLDGKLFHPSVNYNQIVIDQVKIWSIRTGGFVDLITPDVLCAFYRERLEGVIHVDDMRKRDLSLCLDDYDPTTLGDDLTFAPDCIEVKGRKAPISCPVTYDFYELDGERVAVGSISISLATYKRNAREYGKPSQFPELPYGIRLLLHVTVDDTEIAKGFDDETLEKRVGKYEASQRRGKVLAGVGSGEWSGRRWAPIEAGPVPPWYQGVRIRW